MAKTYKILVNDGKGTDIQPVNVVQGAGASGEHVRLVAKRGWRYELQDELKGKGVAPDQVRIKRVGKSMTLMFDGSQNADVVIEDFYAENTDADKDNGMPKLVGTAENGNMYEYVPQDPAVSSMPAELKDGNTPVIMALGGGPLSGEFVLSALPLVAAAGGVSGWLVAGGVAAAAAAGGGGGGGGAAVVDTTAPSAAQVVLPEGPLVNAQEAQDGTPVQVALPKDAVVGDTVTTVVTKPDGSKLTLVHVLTAADVAAATLTQTIPVSELKNSTGQYLDGPWATSTTVTDAAKNVSTPANSTFVLDTTAPVNDDENPLSPAAGKASLVLDEVPNSGVVTGTARGDFTAGDEVTITVNAKPYTGKVDANGKFSIPVPHEMLVDDQDKKIEASLAAHDAAGNVGVVTANKPYVVDASAPTFESSDIAKSVDENILASTVVYQAKAIDSGFVAPATANSITYSLKSGVNDSDAFTIDALSGEVRLKASPDFEGKRNYSFVVIATDDAKNSAEKTISLAVNNVDEVAPVFNSDGAPAAVNENIATSTVVYVAKAEDTDFNSPSTKDSVTYRLKTGQDAAKLAINELTGEVKFVASPDYETKSTYEFTVEAVDAVGNVSEKLVTLNVLNIAESAEITYGKIPGAFNRKDITTPITWDVKVIDSDANQSRLSSTATEVGTYGTFEYDANASSDNFYAWKYTLDNVTDNAVLNALMNTGHDLQVIQSFDGSAYKTIDIAVNSGSALDTQTFNTKSTVGLTVGGSVYHKDTLVLHGSTTPSLVLDLTLATSNAATLNSIECIDLNGANNYTVRLNLASLTQADAVNGVEKLFIDGGSGDRVEVVGRATIPVDTTTVPNYDRYVFDSTHELLVLHGVSVAFSV
jgi:VCBS repeat-containing protein